MKNTRHRLVLMIVVLAAILFASCAGSSPSKRSPINGWRKKSHKDIPGGYHNNGAKSTPF